MNSHFDLAHSFHALSEGSIFKLDYYSELAKIYHGLKTEAYFENERTALQPLFKASASGHTQSASWYLVQRELNFFRDLLLLRFRTNFLYKVNKHDTTTSDFVSPLIETDRLVKRSKLEQIFGLSSIQYYQSNDITRTILYGIYHFFACSLPEAATAPINALLNFGFTLTDYLFISLRFGQDHPGEETIAEMFANFLISIPIVLIRIPFGVVDAVQEIFQLDSFWVEPARDALQNTHLSNSQKAIKVLLHLGKVIFTLAAILTLPGMHSIVGDKLYTIANAVSHALHVYLTTMPIDSAATFSCFSSYAAVLAKNVFRPLLNNTIGRMANAVSAAIGVLMTYQTAYSLAGEVAAGIKPLDFTIDFCAWFFNRCKTETEQIRIDSDGLEDRNLVCEAPFMIPASDTPVVQSPILPSRNTLNHSQASDTEKTTRRAPQPMIRSLSCHF